MNSNCLTFFTQQSKVKKRKETEHEKEGKKGGIRCPFTGIWSKYAIIFQYQSRIFIFNRFFFYFTLRFLLQGF